MYLNFLLMELDIVLGLELIESASIVLCNQDDEPCLVVVLLLADQLGPGEVLELAEAPPLHWTLVSPGSQMSPHRVLPPGQRPQTGRGGHARSSSRSGGKV